MPFAVLRSSRVDSPSLVSFLPLTTKPRGAQFLYNPISYSSGLLRTPVRWCHCVVSFVVSKCFAFERTTGFFKCVPFVFAFCFPLASFGFLLAFHTVEHQVGSLNSTPKSSPRPCWGARFCFSFSSAWVPIPGGTMLPRPKSPPKWYVDRTPPQFRL